MTAPDPSPVPGLSVAELLPGDHEVIQQLLTAPATERPALHDRPDLAVAVARADVVPTLVSWFTPEPGRGVFGWVDDEALSGPVGSDAVCITWSFAGTYREVRRRADGDVVDVAFGENKSLAGFQALGQPVEVHGVTFVELTASATEYEPALRLRRYVDWAGVYTQLGLTLGWRPAHEVAGRGG